MPGWPGHSTGSLSTPLSTIHPSSPLLTRGYPSERGALEVAGWQFSEARGTATGPSPTRGVRENEQPGRQPPERRVRAAQQARDLQRRQRQEQADQRHPGARGEHRGRGVQQPGTGAPSTSITVGAPAPLVAVLWSGVPHERQLPAHEHQDHEPPHAPPPDAPIRAQKAAHLDASRCPPMRVATGEPPDQMLFPAPRCVRARGPGPEFNSPLRSTFEVHCQQASAPGQGPPRPASACGNGPQVALDEDGRRG